MISERELVLEYAKNLKLFGRPIQSINKCKMPKHIITAQKASKTPKRRVKCHVQIK